MNGVFSLEKKPSFQVCIVQRQRDASPSIFLFVRTPLWIYRNPSDVQIDYTSYWKGCLDREAYPSTQLWLVTIFLWFRRNPIFWDLEDRSLSSWHFLLLHMATLHSSQGLLKRLASFPLPRTRRLYLHYLRILPLFRLKLVKPSFPIVTTDGLCDSELSSCHHY